MFPSPRLEAPRRTRTRLAWGVVVCPLALAGCTGASEPPAQPELDDIRAQIEAARPDPRARWDAIEERTAACMAEQGFEYTPVPYGRPDAWQLADPGDLEPGTMEYAQQFGYGVLTTERWAPPEDEPPDVNIERLLEMSPGELPAYTSALWGDDTDLDADVEALGLTYIAVSGPTTDPEAEVGCHGNAEREYDSADAGMAPDQFGAISAEMAALDESIPDDPRLDNVNARWATCMLDAGYPDLERVGDGEGVVYRAFDAGFADLDWGAPGDGVDRQVHQMQLEMQPLEIEVAVADVQCRDEVGYAEALASLTVERQHEFVTEHRAELDAWLAAIAEQPAD